MLLEQLPGAAMRLSITTPDGSVMQWPNSGRIHPLWLELACYLGTRFRSDWCGSADALVHAEFARYPSAEAFYRESEIYLYHLIGYWLEGYKRPAHAWLLQSTGGMPGCTVLDYGCGIGCDGLWMLDAGYQVTFADMAGRSLDFLRWRLAQRWYAHVPVYTVPLQEALPAYHFVWCMDVLEHLPPDEHREFLVHLATLGRFVLVNLIVDPDADGTVHHPLDVEGLTDYLSTRWSVVWQDYYRDAVGHRTRLLCYGAEVPAALLALPMLEGTRRVAAQERL